MLSLHTNAAALSAQNSISRTQSALSTSQTRLSTGFRVNSAMDDAAGLQIATRLKAQTSGMAMAMRNTQNSISMMQTAEGALDETTNILIRMKDLATQAADASSTTADKTAMQSEFDALTQELSNIVGNTSFGGQKLMNDTTGTFAATGGVNFQIGASSGEKMNVDVSTQIATMHASLLAGATNYLNTGVAPATVPTGTELTGSASATIDLLKTAIDDVGAVRSALGAASNRLDHVYNNLANVSTNTKAATGRIMDTDFASESSNMTSSQMLLQAGTAMLKQSNSTSSLVMSLLQ
ncbi:flagellin [Duganella sp. CF402]|uniref:flagellin N-terminal helical domain-containing protein n=1 Tax=unclassified Duganella TaxID=2636909 RepID=UPI0008D6BE6E|nr:MULTISPECIES: flagellin [unclassified Duganella]RZT10013.1 flagellin [Duganella sp. BK701]SEL32726.1 flagellin [Duganella sp. CF402]